MILLVKIPSISSAGSQASALRRMAPENRSEIPVHGFAQTFLLK
jgi:hypothetical protein